MKELLDVVQHYVDKIDSFLWGLPLIICLLGTGIYLTFRLKFVQFRGLGHALYLALIKRKESGEAEGDISHFQALMTALSATVGTGNIAGVATAIAAGGPGALFWMWLTGLFGMATKYAEAVLAVKFRVVDERGEMAGGPMYYLTLGLKKKWLGVAFAIFAAVAAFGIGNMVQSNSVADVVSSSFSVPKGVSGIILAIAVALVVLGGIKSIARVTGVLVPVMILFYAGAALLAFVIHYDKIIPTFQLVFKHAFTPIAPVGGFLGASVKQAVQYGVARGIFSNESGLGSSPIAAAAAKTKHPVTQALVSMTQTFIDTIIVCSLTGFVIVSSGQWTSGLDGAPLTAKAFTTLLSSRIGEQIVAIGLILFAYSTILGWCYYGERAVEFLFGAKALLPYRVIFCLLVVPGAVAELKLVWGVADILNGLMALPNLVALLLLSGVVAKETTAYWQKYRTRASR